MFDYYHYFVEKGNHPDKKDILNSEQQLVFEQFNQEIANRLIHQMIDESKKYEKPISVRIIYQNKVVAEYFGKEESLDWLQRKEKVCYEIQHSSYYVFLDNIDTNKYDYMITDETYGICGGSFPLIVNHQFEGTITVTGLRPHEDHQVVVDALRKVLEERNNRGKN
jgi:uncharacterized protein (UPF0303 family)